MARRIVEVVDPCEHGQGYLPPGEPARSLHWKVWGCPGGSRRVLDPGSFKAHVADALLFDGWTCDFHEPDPDCQICQRQYEKTSQRILDALAGGES